MAFPEHVEQARPAAWLVVLLNMSTARHAVTARQVQQWINPKAKEASGARTRIRELQQAGLIYRDPQPSRYSSYRITLLGHRFLKLHPMDQNSMLKDLRRVRRPLEDARKQDQKDRAAMWDQRIQALTTTEIQASMRLFE